MGFKKLMSAILAGSMTATALLGSAAIPSFAAGETMTFDIQSDGKNSINISAEQIAAGDVTVPVDIYIPENPGVNAINLKFQVNDGEVAEDGSFKNYGFYLSSAQIADQYCFDSEHSGYSSYAFNHDFNAQQMNLVWCYSMNTTLNPDAAAQADSRSWDSSVSWAYQYAFANAELVVPKDTPAGTYVFDIRTEPFVNYLSIGREKQKMMQSSCESATETADIPFVSKPLTIVVEEPAVTTTTTETTTTETTTTTTESTTTTETTTTTESTTTTTATTTSTTETTTTTTAPVQIPKYKIECPAIPTLPQGETYTFTVTVSGENNARIGKIYAGESGVAKRMSCSWEEQDFGAEGTASAEVTITLIIDEDAKPGTYDFSLDALSNSLMNTDGKRISGDQVELPKMKMDIMSNGGTTPPETTTCTSTTTTETTTTTTATTTTETTTTTTATTTTETTTETTTTQTTPTEEPWTDDYKIEDGGHYLMIGNVCGKPGETVKVPVYVYGDPGTAAMRLYFDTPGDAKITDMSVPKNNYAYLSEMQFNPESNPKRMTFAGSEDTIAPDGSIVVRLHVTIPEDAEDGTTYPVEFFKGDATDSLGVPVKQEVGCHDVHFLDPKYYDGSVTVVSGKEPALNYTSYILPKEGETVNLTLFNAYGDVTWSSSDPEVASVDQNGFVVAKKIGSTTVTASNKGKNYTCEIMVGLFGDVDCNGEVAIEDAQLALMEYTVLLAHKDSVLTPTEQKIADVNGDGAVTIDDAQAILQYYTEMLAQKNPTWDKILHPEKY